MRASGKVRPRPSRRHKGAGESVFIWREGKVVQVPPEEIKVNDEVRMANDESKGDGWAVGHSQFEGRNSRFPWCKHGSGRTLSRSWRVVGKRTINDQITEEPECT